MLVNDMTPNMDKTRTIFRVRMRSGREQAGLTQHGLDNKAKLPWSTCSQYEGGFRSPSISVLVKIADALALSTDYLLGRKEE